MRKRDEDFWQAAEDWSRRKHSILSYYLKPAAAKLRSVSADGRVIVVDGYAGRGKYEDGSAGSPIYLGQLADDCKKWLPPLNLRIYNVEPNNATFKELEACTRRWVEEGTMRNLCSTFRSALPFLLSEAGESPLFVFLDPFRPSHLNFEDFLPLLDRRSAVDGRQIPTEICIILHTPLILRMIRAVSTGRQKEQAIESSIESLNQVFGGDRWRELISQQRLEPESVVNCYSNELGTRGNSAYICTHPISVRHGVNLKYHILFFTRHREGVKLVNDAFCKESGEVYSTTGLSAQLTLDLMSEDRPAIEMDVHQRGRILELKILALVKDDPEQKWTRKDLIFQSIYHTFGDFSETEHRQAIQRLVDRTDLPRLMPLDGVWLRGVKRWRINDKTLLKFEDEQQR